MHMSQGTSGYDRTQDRGIKGNPPTGGNPFGVIRNVWDRTPTRHFLLRNSREVLKALQAMRGIPGWGQGHDAQGIACVSSGNGGARGTQGQQAEVLDKGLQVQ